MISIINNHATTYQLRHSQSVLPLGILRTLSIDLSITKKRANKWYINDLIHSLKMYTVFN